MTDEATHQSQAAEIDRVLFEQLETFRALGASDISINAGATAALARFAANTIIRAGGEPSVRAILSGLLKLLNFAAEQIILSGARAPDPAEGGPKT